MYTRSIVRSRPKKILNYIKRHKLPIILTPVVVLALIPVVFIVRDIANSIYLTNKFSPQIVRNCHKNAAKYSWIVCSDITIDPAYPSSLWGVIPGSCKDSWTIYGSARDEEGSVTWSNYFETDPAGNVRGTGRQSFQAWDDQSDEPDIIHDDCDRYPGVESL